MLVSGTEALWYKLTFNYVAPQNQSLSAARTELYWNGVKVASTITPIDYQVRSYSIIVLGRPNRNELSFRVGNSLKTGLIIDNVTLIKVLNLNNNRNLIINGDFELPVSAPASSGSQSTSTGTSVSYSESSISGWTFNKIALQKGMDKNISSQVCQL